MANSFSVRAILSAQDKGFTSTLKEALGATGTLGDRIKSGFAFGVLTGAGQQAFGMLTNGAKELVGEVNSSSKAWQTFEGNMKNFGKNEKQIRKVKDELQSFAETTVYSSSDMASTYAQLEAVGVGGMKKLAKGTSGLVKGFGGLAAAAEDPQQAMKSLSQQATQMAAKPKVAWEDFKIMLEQSPAGMAAVADAMGMSTEKLISKIQAGEVKTQDFFAAIEKAGNSDGFQKMATEAKTIDQAIDGAKEALGNKLLPAFGVVSEFGIKAIDGIAEKIGKIDGEKLATKLTAGIEAAKPYWESFKYVLSSVGGVLKSFGTFLAEHKDTIAKYLPTVLKLALGFKAFKVVSAVVPGVKLFTSAIGGLAGKGIAAITKKLFGIAGSEKVVGKTSAASAKQVMTCAKSFLLMSAAVLIISVGFALLAQSAIALAGAGGPAIAVMFGLIAAIALLGAGMMVLMKSLAPMAKKMMPVATAMLAMGAAVLLVSAGFALLAQSAIALAAAGTPAILCMVGMVAAIALLAVGAAALGPALTAGAVGFIAFGAAVLMVGAGALLASASMAILAAQLPIICSYGLQGAVAIAALGASMIVYAAGAALAGAASIVLGAGLTVAAVGITACGVAALVAAAGIIALAAGCTLLGASLMLTAASVTLLGGALPLAASGALLATASLAALLGVSVGLMATLTLLNAPLVLIGATALIAGAGMTVFGAGLIVAGAGALIMAAGLKAVNSSMKSIAKNAKSTQKSLTSMQSSVKTVSAGLDALGNKAKSAMNSITNAFNNTASKAKSAGQKVGNGFANGMKSGLAKAKSAAASTVTSVTSRLRSGRSGAYSAGAYISLGFAQGMRSQLGSIRSAANQMVAAANKAIQAKAKIHSPSKLTDKLGGYYGEGFVNGVLGMVRDAQAAAERLVTIPAMNGPELAFAGAYGGELSADYDYTRKAEYNITVVSTLDGREVARNTATYMQHELDRNQTRENRKHGRR